jgi:hypothetical protein
VLEQDRSQVYSYDQRDRLIGFQRGSIEVVDNVATFGEPITDPELPSHQDWMPVGTTGLDRRGNP